MEIGLSWNLALLFFLFGVSLQAAAALLVLSLGAARLPRAHRLGQSAALLVFLGIALEVIALFVPPETPVEGYWFVLGVSPLLLPALLLRLVPAAASEGGKVPTPTPTPASAPEPSSSPSSASASVPASTSAPAPAPAPAPPATGAPRAGEERERAPTEFQRFLEEIPAVLAEHPEGLTLVEIGRELNVEWRKLTGAARELLDRGLVRKEEKRYFLVKGP